MLRDRYFWISIIGAGFCLVFTLWYGVGADQPLFIYSAWVWKHHHLPPYIGSWDHNLPGIHLVHLFALSFFGESILGFRIFDFLVQLSSLMMLFYLSKRLCGSSLAGFFSTLFYGIYYWSHGSWGVGQREGFILWCLLLSLTLSFALEKQRWLSPVVCGLVNGFAFLLKPFFGLAWLVFGIWFLKKGLSKDWRQGLLYVGLFGVCCLIPLLMVLLYYWKNGYLLEFYYAVIWYNLKVYARMTEPIGGVWFWWLFMIPRLIFLDQPLAFFSGLLGSLVLVRSQEGAKEARVFWMILGLILVSFLAYVLQAKYFPYHLIPFWGLMMILAGFGISWLGSRLLSLRPEGKTKPWGGLFYFACLGLMFINLNPGLLLFTINYSFRNLRQAYLAEPAPSQAHRTMIIDHYLSAEYLKPRIQPQDQIALFSYHPLLALELKKKLPSRFSAPHLLLFRSKAGILQPLQRKWIKEYSESIISSRPRFFVIIDPPILVPDARTQPYRFCNLPYQNLTQALGKEFPELYAFLLNNYQLVKKFDYTEIYELSSR